MNVVASIQYRVVNEHAKEAFYKLSRPQAQIQAYVFDGMLKFEIIVWTDVYILFFILN